MPPWFWEHPHWYTSLPDATYGPLALAPSLCQTLPFTIFPLVPSWPLYCGSPGRSLTTSWSKDAYYRKKEFGKPQFWVCCWKETVLPLRVNCWVTEDRVFLTVVFWGWGAPIEMLSALKGTCVGHTGNTGKWTLHTLLPLLGMLCSPFSS